jgi:hypothetical protein
MDSFLVSQALLQNIKKGPTVTNALAYRTTVKYYETCDELEWIIL